MADQKNGKGFSGFDDLVSDISKDLEQANKATANGQSDPNQHLEQPPSQNGSFSQSPSPAQRPNEGTTPTFSGPCTDPIVSMLNIGLIRKWWSSILAGLVIVYIIYSFVGEKKVSSYKPGPEKAPAPQIVLDTPSANSPTPPQPRKSNKTRKGKPQEEITLSPVLTPSRMDLTRNEIMPQIGTNNVLSRDEIRYCLSEKIRISAMKEAVDRYSETEIDYFNTTVQRYNSRCAQFRYRKGSLESVRSEVDAARAQLELEGMSRVYNLR